MPLLSFDVTTAPTAEEKRAFADEVRDRYADVMDTETGHVAVVVRDRDPADLSLGRSVDGPHLFLDADVREGRPVEQRREFALAVMDEAADRWGVPEPNVKVAFTQHAGPEMMGYDRVGEEWDGEG